MSTVDTAAVSAEIERIEAEIHKHGWDEEPELHLLYRGAEGLESHKAFAGLRYEGGHGERLLALALELESKRDTPVGRFTLNRLRNPNCVALVFVAEAYANFGDGMTREQMREYAAGRRGALRIADRPGSVELRTVGGYDRDGNVYLYRRIRGRQPEPIVVYPSEGRSLTEVPAPIDMAGGSNVIGSIGTGVVGKIPFALSRLMMLIVGEDEPAGSALPEWLRGKS